MKVSVIIPAYNAAPTIRETLLSLQAQTFPDWEAIIINDGSSDDTFTTANEFAIQDSRIRVINQLNQGVSAARNFGVKEALSDWVLFLDADDWILPQHLEKLTEVLKLDATLDAVYSGWVRVTPDGKTVNYDYSNQASQMFAAFARSCVFAIHSCIVRRSIILDVGGFDPELPTCEEWDLWQRIARTGARFAAIPEMSACYRMRPNSASFNTRQLLYDGLKVITQGHSPDSRVKNPSPAYATGMPEQELSGAKLIFACWVAGLALGSGADFLPILAAVENEQEPGLNPEIIALSIFWSTFLPTSQTPSDWYELWLKLESQIIEFLTALEKLSLAPDAAIRALRKLQNLILEHSTATKPLTLGTVYAIQQEITEPFIDIVAPSHTERLHCIVTIQSKHLGNVILPICDGVVSSYVLQDAIAAQFAWEILSSYFENTVYRQLTTKRTSTGLSIWRGNIHLALISENETLHNHIGWIVFLQELWGANWEQSYFYNENSTKLQQLKAVAKILQQTNIKSISENFIPTKQQVENWVTVEVSQKLPTLITSAETLQIIPTIGGVALGTITHQVKDNKVTPQQLRTTIIHGGRYELAVAAVREGLLGMPLTGNLRERLAKKPLLQNPNDTNIMFGRHAGAIGTSSSRRATFPLAAKQDLQKAASLANEKFVETNEYRIQLFQALSDSTPTIPEIIEIPQPTPPPAQVANTVLWHGGSPQDYWHEEIVTAKLPILMYHRVHPEGKAATASWRVTPEAFEQQLKYLQEAGYYSVSLADWGEAILNKQPLPGRAILITFDDGYQDFYDFAFPLLKRYGFSATVFLVANNIGQTNTWDSVYDEELPLMGWDTIKELQSQGIEFGAHTATHPHLTALSPLEIVTEATRARIILQQGLGRVPVTFAYPYGDTDAVVQHLVGACGYIYGVSCKRGLSSFQDSLLALSRVEVTGNDTLAEFVAKLS